MDEIRTNATFDERVAKGQQIRLKGVKKNLVNAFNILQPTLSCAKSCKKFFFTFLLVEGGKKVHPRKSITFGGKVLNLLIGCVLCNAWLQR